MVVENFSIRNQNGRTTSDPRLTFNDVDGNHRINTQAEAQEAIRNLSTLPGSHTHDVIVLSDGHRQNYQDVLDLSRPQVSTVITLPTLRQTVTVPGAIGVPGGISINGLEVTLSSSAHGQQFRLDNFRDQTFHLASLLPPNVTEPRELTFDLHVTDQPNAQGHHDLDISFHFTSSAQQIVSQGNPDELVCTLDAVRFGRRSTGELSGTSGELSLSGNTISLDGVNFSGQFPRIQARVNTQTGNLRLELAPVPPPSGAEAPTTNLGNWLGLPATFWQTRTTAIQQNPGALTLSPASADLPNAGKLIERGLGATHFYPAPNQNGAVAFEFNFRNEQSLANFQNTFIDYIRANLQRDLPNPPPRDRNDEEPLALSYAQETDGTLFFLRYLNERREVMEDEDLGEELIASLGVQNASLANASLANGRINWATYLSTYTRNPAISGMMTPEVVTALFRSYTNSPTELTQRRFGHRGILALGSLLQTEASQGLAGLLAPSRQFSSMRPMAAHEFIDNRYHVETPSLGADTVDMRYSFVFNQSPDQIAQVLDTVSAHELDPYRIQESTGTGEQRTYNVLGHDINITHRRRPGTDPLIVIDEFSSHPETQGQFSRTFRLIPITVQGQTKTLVIVEEQINLPGNENNLPFPMLQRPGAETQVFASDPSGQQSTGALFRDRLIQGIPQVITTAIDASQNHSDAFAYIFSNISQRAGSAQSTPRPVTRPEELVCLNPGSRTTTTRKLDYLNYYTPEGRDPVLVINDLPSDAQVREDLHRRWDFEVPASWLRRVPHPNTEQTGQVRLINLREAWAASGVAPTATRAGIDFDSFNGLTQLLLSPPEGNIRVAMSHLTSPTARYFIFTQELANALTPGHEATIFPTGNDYPMNFRVLKPMSFHSVISPGNTQVMDTADSIVTFYVPTGNTPLSSADLADVGYQAWLFGPNHRNMHGIDRAVEIPSNLVPNAAPGHHYVSSLIAAAGAYNTDAGNGITQLTGGVTAAPWLMVNSLPNYTNEFFENWGTWIYIPVKENSTPNARTIGFIGVRYSITNTKNKDMDAIVARTARGEVPQYLTDYAYAAYETAYTRGAGNSTVPAHTSPRIHYVARANRDQDGRPAF